MFNSGIARRTPKPQRNTFSPKMVLLHADPSCLLPYIHTYAHTYCLQGCEHVHWVVRSLRAEKKLLLSLNISVNVC